jgi:hypothetical protein
MGLISDNLEQANEAFANRGWSFDRPREYPPHDGLTAVRPFRVFECTACHAAFDNEGLLRNHIASTHGARFTYVLLNDRISQRIEVLSQRPDVLSVVVGREPIRVHLNVGTDPVTIQLSPGVNDLLTLVPEKFTGTLKIAFSIDGIRHEYHLAIGETPVFRIAELTALAQRLQLDLDIGRNPDWNGFQADLESLSASLFERRFLDGFLEYSLGFDMEKKGRWEHSASHLETALHLLEPFCTRMAVTAKRVLGVRLNCFSALRRCEPTSRFHLARLFFLDNLDAGDNLSQAGVGMSTTEDAVYCDGLTERLLAILKAFYARDLHNVIGPCQQLRHEPAAQDRNNSDKLDLLMARASHLAGDRDAARLYYSRVQDHPDFAQEAAAYIRNPH